VYDKGFGEIPRGMQLVAGRVGQEYNLRKDKKGAFWEDRYHATAVDTEQHLLRCCRYIDFNMIRAGVVDHPDQWPACGYNEIIEGKERYRIIDRDMLSNLVGHDTLETFGEMYRKHMEDALYTASEDGREPEWTESIAVGSEEFVDSIKINITHIRASWQNRIHNMADGTAILYDTEEQYGYTNSYNVDFGGKMGTLRAKNSWF
jgi:putative transposase